MMGPVLPGRTISSLLLLAVLGVGSGEAEARPRYRAVRLYDADTLITGYGNASPGFYPSLNDRNQVVFLNMFVGGRFTSMYWQDGELHPLIGEGAYTQVSAHAINNQSQFSGSVTFNTGVAPNIVTHFHGFRTIGGAISELPTDPAGHDFPDNCFQARATDLNDFGDAAGWANKPLTPTFGLKYPVAWQSGSLVALGPLNPHPPDSQFMSGNSTVHINNAGTVAGTMAVNYSGCPNCELGYYGTPGSLTEIAAFPGGRYVGLWDLNNQGSLVGQSDGVFGGTYRSWHALLFENGQKKDIHGTGYGTLQPLSRAFAINDSGVAVGVFGNIGPALYYEKDTTWVLDSLVDNVVDNSFPDLYEAFDINNRGFILALYNYPSGTPYPCLLVPIDSQWVVNTDNDLPDLNPNDGRCYTGNTTPLGDDECSFRAAIQHTNAMPGPDTIRFDIPSAGLPQVLVGTPLPTVTERVVIDATTQPNTHRVEVAPADSLVGGNGLTLQSGRSTVRGLLLNGFAESGLLLQGGDSNVVEACHFGVRADSTTPWGNGLHGVHLSGTYESRVGDGSDDQANLIAFNGGAGVYVESGAANTFLRNIYHHNGGLGIDLAPPGPNPNDTLDVDGGANDGVNYPTIDSAVTGVGITMLYGTLVAEPQVSYIVEISTTDTCDTSGYGEGQEAVWSTVAITNVDGVAAFATSVPTVLDSGEPFTLTATDTAQSTSEFGPCWPDKRVRLLVSTGQPIASKSFALSRVAFDPADFTETLLDTVTTDAQGWVNLYSHVQNGTLRAGDSVKFERVLTTLPRGKSGLSSPGHAMAVYLDNGRFDSATSELSYDELTTAARQDVWMTHTTLGVNLVFSVEWEADSSYLDLIAVSMVDLCNYLYDVTDGQMKLDTVWVYANRMFWEEADVRVHGSNVLRHRAQPRGLFRSGAFSHVFLGRRRFATLGQAAADSSYNEWPMRPDNIIHYRSLGHELGHYVLDLGDEYFELREQRCSQSQLYGFMETHYLDDEPMSSEMSWDRQYTSLLCRNTDQWETHGKSCWDVVESVYQTSYDGVHAEIIKPDERNMPASPDYFHGPNEYTLPLQVDVASRTKVHVLQSARTSKDVLLDVTAGVPAAPVPGTDVTTWHALRRLKMEQGLTSSSGGIRLVGVKSGDSLFASSGAIRQGLTQGAHAAADSDWVWYSLAHELPGALGDSLSLALNPVAGYLPALCTFTLEPGAGSFSLQFENPFGNVPSLEFPAVPDTGDALLLPMTQAGGSYTISLPFDSGYAGEATVHALDAVSSPFFFPAPLVIQEVTSAIHPGTIASGAGSCRLNPGVVSGDGRISMCTTPYLPLRAGQPAEARQAGRTVSVSTYPSSILSGVATLSIDYSEAQFTGAPAPFDNEMTVQIFTWDTTSHAWVAVGGNVDSAANQVAAVIPGPGLYAAFTTGQVVGVGDDHGDGAITPDQFELGQNQPNPFNPTTSIWYSLPLPGRVTLVIHNLLGQKVRTLVDEVQVAGRHETTWDGRNAAGDEVGSGVYFYTLKSGDNVLTHRMLLLK